MVLKERFGAHRWIAIALGYIGVAVAMRPGFDALAIGYLLALIGSLSYALMFISGKLMSKTESTTALVFYFNAGVGVVTVCLLPLFWQALDLAQWGLILAVSAFALLGHFAITQAFSSAEASLLAPLEYSGLLWAIALDYCIWGHAAQSHTLLGGSIVVVSGLYFLYRERYAARG